MKNKKWKSEELLSRIRNQKNLSLNQQIMLVLNLSLPAIMAQITSIVMQYIDAAMVGHMGANASASIGLVSTTTWLFGSVAFAATTGFSVQVAQFIGAKKEMEARNVLKHGLIMTIIVTAILALAGVMISGALPKWLGASAEIQKNASAYFLIYACFIPAAGLNALAGGMLQCSGNMRLPSILNGCMCILDVIFNALLIFPSHHFQIGHITLFIPGADLGVLGAALGTALAELVIASLMLYFLCVKSPMLHFRKNQGFAKTFRYVIQAIKIAWPIAFEHIVVCSAMIVTTKIVAPLGVIAIAANSFAITAESLCYMPGYGIADAATTLVGQSIGAGREELTRRFARMTTYLGILIMTITGILMFIFAPVMIAILSPDADIQAIGTKILRIEAFAEPMYAASIVVSGALRGAGDTLIPSIMNFVSLWIVRIPLALLFVGRFGLTGVWLAMCLELCFRGVIFLIRLYGERWRKKAVK